MDSPSGTTADSLIRSLESQAACYDFFLAVRLLECARRDLPRIGHSALPSQDPVRFGQEPAVGFPASAIEKLDQPAACPAPRLSVRFFGLFGPQGPLPLHLTEYARERKLHAKDHTFSAFADMFHHRMISFFYRAWACNEPTVSYDRQTGAADIHGDADTFAGYFAGLIGLGTVGLQNRDSVPDTAKLHFAGRLLPGPRNAESLRAILTEFFNVRAEIQEFSGRWLQLPAEAACRLGSDPESGLLGQTLVIGERVWDVQGKFRVVLGPMNLRKFESLLPGSPGFQKLCDWVKLFLNDELEWDLQLILSAACVPPAVLGGGCRLGYTTWLQTAELSHDADDLICRPAA